MRACLGLLLILVGSVNILLGQSAETGLPFISEFTPRQYKANNQNWAAVQDQRGVMYFANNRGVLEYDGINWNLIPASNNSTIRSLAIDHKGTIFVGAVGEFGFLAPDEKGQLSYHSLLDKVAEADRMFSDVWTTLVKGDEVYFQTLNLLFRYKNGTISSWPLQNSYHRSFIVGGQLYVRSSEKGLMVMQQDSLQTIAGGELYAQASVSAMLPYGDKILIGSRTLGLHLYDPAKKSLQSFETPANHYLRENILYHGIVMADGNYAFSTLNKGILLMRPDGHILNTFDRNSGLQNNIAYYLFSDRSGDLWLCLGSGISKLEILSPISVYDKKLGLEGGILDIIRHEGTLYVSTHQGVFYLADNERFVQIKGVSVQCWQFELVKLPGEPAKQKLLVVSTDGTYQVSKDGLTLVYGGRTSAILNSSTQPGRVYIGLNGSFASIRYENGSWVEEGNANISKEEFRSLYEDEAGNVWMASLYSGLFRFKTKDWLDYLHTKDQAAFNEKVKHYGLQQGMQSLNWNYFFKINNKMVVATQKGIYHYDPQHNLFEKEARIHAAFAEKERWFYHLQEDEAGNLWFDSDKGKGLLLKNEAGYTLLEKPFKQLGASLENVVTGYTEAEGILWFGTPDGLFRFDSKITKDYEKPFNTLIRKVVVGEDSLVFKGTFYEQANPALAPQLLASFQQPSSLKQQLHYLQNSILFHYAATNYEQENPTLFSHYLEGYDNNWSAWTSESKKEYTNLPEGTYTFKVRAKNIYDTISKESAYEFSISPPWYRSPLAYAGYLLAMVAMVTLVSKANTRRLKKDNLRLETIIESRTAEIKQQKEKIEHQKNQVEKSYQHLGTLSKIGQHITASLDLSSIINTFYTSIDALMQVDAFGVGIYNEAKQSLDFQHAYQDGKALPAFSYSLSDENRLAVWCLTRRKKIIINDLEQEFSMYISALTTPIGGQHATSMIYLPLKIKKRIIGIITVQSYQKNAYQPHHLDMLRTLAAYAAIALDNSYAYLKLNETNEELSTTLENLKQTQTQLVQSEKMASLGQLTAGVAHEINNPINFVSAGIDSLSSNYQDLQALLNLYGQLKAEQDNSHLLQQIASLKKELDLDYLLKETPQLLAGIRTGAQRTTEIVKSLKNFARLDEETLKKADLHEGLESTLIILRNKMSNRIVVERLYEQELPQILCYPGQLNQVFMNILNNATQAIEGSGKISIQTKRAGNWVLISIRDTGKGMSSEVKERIFEPFFTTKEVGDGTGLGLSISYSIIEKHLGKIEVESSPAQGTEFIIYLPLKLSDDGR